MRVTLFVVGGLHELAGIAAVAAAVIPALGTARAHLERADAIGRVGGGVADIGMGGAYQGPVAMKELAQLRREVAQQLRTELDERAGGLRSPRSE